MQCSMIFLASASACNECATGAHSCREHVRFRALLQREAMPPACTGCIPPSQREMSPHLFRGVWCHTNLWRPLKHSTDPLVLCYRHSRLSHRQARGLHRCCTSRPLGPDEDHSKSTATDIRRDRVIGALVRRLRDCDQPIHRLTPPAIAPSSG